MGPKKARGGQYKETSHSVLNAIEPLQGGSLEYKYILLSLDKKCKGKSKCLFLGVVFMMNMEVLKKGHFSRPLLLPNRN